MRNGTLSSYIICYSANPTSEHTRGTHPVVEHDTQVPAATSVRGMQIRPLTDLRGRGQVEKLVGIVQELAYEANTPKITVLSGA